LDEATGKILGLLDEHGGRLHKLLVKLTLRKDVAEDLLQDLFLRLSTSKGFLRSPNPERYLFRAAINLAFDWRKRDRRASAARELTDQDAAQQECPVEKLIRREELERILAAMDRLSEAHRELITMRYINGLSYDELAEHLDSTPHCVRALCSKAIVRLRKLIGPDAICDQPQEVPHVQQRYT
jgi:RNA polymerase sigma-70 factor (ECF subfamily)